MNEPTPEDLAAASTAKKTYPTDPHRLLPQSPDAEKGVLSSCLIAFKEVVGLCIEKGVTKEWFFIPAHATIWETLLGFWERHEVCDFITLTQALRDAGTLDGCGGAAFTTDLFTFLPTAANASYYLEILQEKYMLRNGIKVCTEFITKAYNEQDDVSGAVDQLESEVLKIRRIQVIKEPSASQLVASVLSNLEYSYAHPGTLRGLTTGLHELDWKLNGLEPGDDVVIAARPSKGKTAIAMNIAEHIAISLARPIAFFSFEMSAQQLMQRAVCGRARVNALKLSQGHGDSADFRRLNEAGEELSKAPMHFYDCIGMSIQSLVALARRVVQEYGVQAIFTDYLQRVKSDSKKAAQNRAVEVAEISGACKDIARSLKIPHIVLAQIDRDVERKQRRPLLSDLRESSAIEQDADKVIFIHPEEEDEDSYSGKTTLIVAKNRNGEVGDVSVRFDKFYSRFVNLNEPKGPDTQSKLPL
jgi:replicative DNA helicase